MEDLIATLNGNMHVSQELAELENFKAHLARTLVIPAPISPELDGQIPRARAPSLAHTDMVYHHLDDMPLPPSHQPFPSPVAQYASFDFGTGGEMGLPEYPASSFTPTYSYDQRPTPHASGPTHAQLQEESIAALKSAFAGDAFASTVTWAQPAVNEKQADPWRMFTQSNGASVFGSFGQQQASHNALGFAAGPVDNEPVPQYSQQDESMDEDMAEAALDFDEEERAVNDSYYPDPYGISRWQ